MDYKAERKNGLLQFYFDMKFARSPTASYAPATRARRACILAALALSACATVETPTKPAAPQPSAPQQAAPYVEPPPPPVNLQGFPPSYRLGFGDGCATSRGSEKKDPVRFGNDGNYRVGWQDGLAQCKAK